MSKQRQKVNIESRILDSKKLYMENGYVNMNYIFSLDIPFVFLVGTRGCGKTYNTLKHLIEYKKKFIMMRRTSAVVKKIMKGTLQPFQELNHDMGWNIQSFKEDEDLALFFKSAKNEKGKWVKTGDELGKLVALTTLSNLRGFSAFDVDCMFYDEFIPEEHNKKISGEADAFFNAYETINRNRELKGNKPLQCICAANSNDLANSIFVSLRIVNTICQMQEEGREYYYNKRRGLLIILVNNSPISAQKSKTALYKLTENTDFYDMALKNKFKRVTYTIPKSLSFSELRLIFGIGEIYVYAHKKLNKLYVSPHCNGVCETFGISNVERKKVFRQYNYVWYAYMNNNVIFENIYMEILFIEYFNNTA